MPHRGHLIRATTRQLRRTYQRLICWLWHHSTWKIMDIPHGRVHVYELGCRKCPQVWYVPAVTIRDGRIRRAP
jgi:hypothetical protein